MSCNICADVEHKVEFYDVDSMDVVWHGNYVKYFEKARCALLDKIGYGYKHMREDGFAFPVTSLKIKYIRPLFFQQEIMIRAELLEYENRLKIQYFIYDKKSMELTTKGESIQMAFDMSRKESCFDCPTRLVEQVRKISGENR